MATAVMSFYRTSIGKKVVMAVSGILLFGFVFVHMLGNLQLYSGPAKLNAYAALLASMPAVVWATRITLLLAAVLHVLSATQLTLQSWASRPIKYQKQRYQESSYAARTMRWGGPIIAMWLIYHLLHFTTGHAHGSFVKHDVYANVIAGFKVWWISATYIVAMVLLGLHLFHGVWSMLQTLGANHPKYNQWRKIGAVGFAVLVAGVNISFPLAVLTGLVK